RATLLPVAVNDPGAIQVVRGQLDPHAVTREDANPEPAHLASDMAEHNSVHVVELHAEHRIRQSLDDFTLELDLLFFWHWSDCISEPAAAVGRRRRGWCIARWRVARTGRILLSSAGQIRTATGARPGP